MIIPLSAVATSKTERIAATSDTYADTGIDRTTLRSSDNNAETDVYLQENVAEHENEEETEEMKDEKARRGKNSLEVIPYFNLWPLDYGVIYRIWTGHFYTQLIAEYMPLGIPIIEKMLEWASEKKIPDTVLFTIASFIDNVAKFTPEQIRAKDHGNGVRWDYYDSFIYSEPTIIDSVALYSQ